jgi:hypothetical protein
MLEFALSSARDGYPGLAGLASAPKELLEFYGRTAVGWRAPYIFYHGGKRAIDLYRRCPAALVFLAKQMPPSERDGIEFIRAACRGDDLVFLQALGLPRSRALFRVLAKTNISAWTFHQLTHVAVYWEMNLRVRLWLQHLKTITADVVRLLDHHERISWSLVEGASRSTQVEISDRFEALVTEWEEWVNETGSSRYWPYANLRFEQLQDAIDRLHLKRHFRRPFPRPPLPGAAYIFPLMTLEALHAEGRRQRNCIFNFHRSIESGAAYAYALRRPKCRCTVLLTRGYTGVWVVSDLRAWHNSEPSIQAKEEIQAWISNNQPLVAPEDLWDVPPIRPEEAWDEDGDYDPEPTPEDDRVDWPDWDDDMPF